MLLSVVDRAEDEAGGGERAGDAGAVDSHEISARLPRETALGP